MRVLSYAQKSYQKIQEQLTSYSNTKKHTFRHLYDCFMHTQITETYITWKLFSSSDNKLHGRKFQFF